MPLKGDTENNPIVLDFGEVYTKIGVNGDLEPRAVIPTAVSKPGKSMILFEILKKNIIFRLF